LLWKEEAIAKREEKRRQEKEATCAQFFDLTKKAIEVDESLEKAKAMEAEAKLLVEEREIMFVHTTNMKVDQKAWVEKRRAIIQQCKV
jgi:FtsZ-binding cell division protein ZapB